MICLSRFPSSSSPFCKLPAASNICLSSRNSLSGFWHGAAELQTRCSIFWTLHHAIQGTAPLVASLAKELHSCWAPAGSMSQPAPCPAVVLCTQALGVLSDFGCAALPVQAQRLLFPQSFIFCTWCLALVQNTRRVVTVFWEEAFQHFWNLLHAALGDALFFPESPNYHFHSDIITTSFHSAVSPYPFYSSSQCKCGLCCENLPASPVPLFSRAAGCHQSPFETCPCGLWWCVSITHFPITVRSYRSRRNLSFSPSCSFREFPPE